MVGTEEVGCVKGGEGRGVWRRGEEMRGASLLLGFTTSKLVVSTRMAQSICHRAVSNAPVVRRVCHSATLSHASVLKSAVYTV